MGTLFENRDLANERIGDCQRRRAGPARLGAFRAGSLSVQDKRQVAWNRVPAALPDRVLAPRRAVGAPIAPVNATQLTHLLLYCISAGRSIRVGRPRQFRPIDGGPKPCYTGAVVEQALPFSVATRRAGRPIL